MPSSPCSRLRRQLPPAARLLAAGLAAGLAASPVTAAPYLPQSAAQVLERLPLAPTDPTAGGDDGAASSGGGGASGANADKVGAQCVKNADCPSNACLFKKNADYGYCSKTCQSFTECPTFWTCEAVQNGSSKYCTQK